MRVKTSRCQNVIEAIEKDIATGQLSRSDLDVTLEKNLAARYAVSRDTVRKARNHVLSKSVERQIATNDK
jgi:DNA-binding GntR family transcriptional regulator